VESPRALRTYLRFGTNKHRSCCRGKLRAAAFSKGRLPELKKIFSRVACGAHRVTWVAECLCRPPRAHRARSAHFRQPLRSLSHHVYAPLQLLLQVRDVHLVRDALSVADALHIAVLNQPFQAPHYGYARQLQRVRDLTCATGEHMTVRRKM
jgi:hypothetical protein